MVCAICCIEKCFCARADYSGFVTKENFAEIFSKIGAAGFAGENNGLTLLFKPFLKHL